MLKNDDLGHLLHILGDFDLCIQSLNDFGMFVWIRFNYSACFIPLNQSKTRDEISINWVIVFRIGLV